MNRVVYSSGVNIWDPSYLSTLCVFYDEVLLPACDENSSREVIEFSRPAGSTEGFVVTAIALENMPVKTDNGVMMVEQIFTTWQEKNKPLFEAGVLSRIPKFHSDELFLNLTPSANEWKAIYNLLLDIPFKMKGSGRTSKGDEREHIYLWQDHVLHLVRDDLTSPSIFVANERHHNREKLKGLLAFAAFQFLLPKLSELHPDQILEVRERVAATREGFSMHLQTLSSEVESRLREGDSLDNIARYARSVAEVKIIPDYVEFRRQLEAERAGFWAKVLDKASKIAEIDSAPWTPKFYAEVLKALGFTLLTSIAEGEKRLTNKAQAFQFIRQVEEAIEA